MNLENEKKLILDAPTNPESFGILFDAYYPVILKYCVRRVGNVVVAEDIVSETFVKAFKNINRFKWQEVSILAWFYKIATNEIRMYFRSGKLTNRSLDQLREDEGIEPLSEIDVEAEAIETQTNLERHSQFLVAHQLLLNMPIKYQEVISLRFVERKKISEIGFILGKKDNTVKSLLFRGLARLKYELEAAQTQPFENTGIVLSETSLITESEGQYEE